MREWPFVDICKYCPPSSFTISGVFGCEPVIRNVICDAHSIMLAQQNEQWNERHRYELWLEMT